MSIIEKLGITPGPWVNDDGWHVQTDVGIRRDKTRHICSAPSDYDSTIADFDLIAAAPEMLEALIRDVIIYEDCFDDGDYVEHIVCQRKIIEKATGRTWEEIKELSK